MAWLPKQHYPRAELHCTLPACHETGEVGLAFDVEAGGPVLRLRISAEAARVLATSLLNDQRLWSKGAQSPISSIHADVQAIRRLLELQFARTA